MRNEELGIRNGNPVVDKSKTFAIRIVKMYKYLTEKRSEYVMSKQVLRCGTSIGANVREAIYAQTKADFLSKMYIAFKEAGETAYWLEILEDTGYLTPTQAKSIRADCAELTRILSSITKTLKEKNS